MAWGTREEVYNPLHLISCAEMFAPLVALLFSALQASSIAPKGPWDNFNFAPKNRTSRPARIHSTQGNVQNAQALVGFGTATITGNGSFVVVDFGQEVA